MKTINYLIIGLIIFFFSFINFNDGAAANWYDSASIRIDSIRKANFTLRLLDKNGDPITDSIKIDLFRHEFVFGSVLDPETGSWEKATLYKFYNAAVCGNAFKWSGIEAQQGVLTYDGFDKVLSWCESVGIPLKGHCLLWNGHAGNYHEVPQWVQLLSPTAMNDACKNRITREVSRYKGRVFEYDVMNEPSHTTFLSSHIGDSIFWNCFKWARQTDSAAQLYVNDYNTIEWDEYQPFINIVDTALKHGAPIDGIGIQAHFGSSINTNDVKRRLDKLASLGLKMRITEFDMQISQYNVSPLNQALYYARMLRIAFSYPSITGFYFWGIVDGSVWRAGSGIFNSDRTPKPAADSVYNLIHKEWSTNIVGVTDNNGSINFRGFLGKYKVMAKIDGQWKEFLVNCGTNEKGTEIVLYDTMAVVPGPKLVKAVLIEPTKIELKFDKNMADPSVEGLKFEVYSKTTNPITTAQLKEGDSTVIVLNLKNKLLFNSYVVVANLKGGIKAADSSKLEIFGSEPVINMLPGVYYAATNQQGDEITLKFNKDMQDFSENKDSIKIFVNKAKVEISNISFKDDSSSVMLITLKNPVNSGDIITFSYNPGTWLSVDNIALPATSINVTNNVPSYIELKMNQNKFDIYPNPCSGKCTVICPNDFKKLIITDILGQDVITLNIDKTPYLLDLKDLKEGLYFVKLISDNNQIKIIKMNKIK